MMSEAALELVSHPLCPRSHRAALIARLAGAAGERLTIKHLPYPRLPELISQYSITGNLPVLYVDGRLASDDIGSIAIYLDDAFGTCLIPDALAERFRVQTAEAAVEIALDILRQIYGARDEQTLTLAMSMLFEQLERVETVLPQAAGDELGYMESLALATLAALTGAFAFLSQDSRWKLVPHTMALVERLRENPVVIATMAPAYQAEFEKFFALTQSRFPMLSEM